VKTPNVGELRFLRDPMRSGDDLQYFEAERFPNYGGRPVYRLYFWRDGTTEIFLIGGTGTLTPLKRPTFDAVMAQFDSCQRGIGAK
jgi:hypothetical protein